MIPVTRVKEVVAMRIGAIFMLTAFLLTGCVHMKNNQNVNMLERIQKGDSQEAVLEIMGPPDLRKDIGDNRTIAYYQTQAGTSSKEVVTTNMCTPIAFEDGVVVSVGEDLEQVWTQEEEARLRQMGAAERRRSEAEMKAAARRKVEQERLDKIAALEKKVKPVPASNAALNLKLYRQLLELNPDNTRYQKKVAFYEARLVQQKKAREARAARTLEKKQRQAWEQSRDQRNKALRHYTGNGIAEMAVHDMGPGSMYVWVKNVSRQVITTHPDHFILLDSQGNRVECTISSSLDSVLQPGAISHGKIEYSASVYPGELIFRNREAGRVSKTFQ
jgi:hypothetical protein